MPAETKTDLAYAAYMKAAAEVSRIVREQQAAATKNNELANERRAAEDALKIIRAELQKALDQAAQ